MDTLFFWASKLLWALISPDSLLLILLLCSAVLLHLQPNGWLFKAGRRLLTLTCVLALLVAYYLSGRTDRLLPDGSTHCLTDSISAR